MDKRPRIRDTAGQDQVLSTAAMTSTRRKPWLLGGALGVALLVLAIWVVVGWSGGGRSYDASRIRIAEVTRGDLVRTLSYLRGGTRELLIEDRGVLLWLRSPTMEADAFAALEAPARAALRAEPTATKH